MDIYIIKSIYIFQRLDKIYKHEQSKYLLKLTNAECCVCLNLYSNSMKLYYHLFVSCTAIWFTKLIFSMCESIEKKNIIIRDNFKQWYRLSIAQYDYNKLRVFWNFNKIFNRNNVVDVEIFLTGVTCDDVLPANLKKGAT